MRQRGLAKTNGAHNNHADPCTSCTLPSPEGRGRGWGSREPKIAFDTPGDQEARAGARASFEKFDLAFNPINTIRHLTSDAAMLAHLACVRRALAPSGLYIVGLEVSDPALAQPTEDVWIGRTGDLRVQQNVSYLPPESGRKEAVISHLTITTGRGQRRLERHIDTRYHLRTYTRAQWDALLRRAGWTVLAAYGPSGRAKDTNRCTFGYFVWVLSPHR